MKNKRAWLYGFLSLAAVAMIALGAGFARAQFGQSDDMSSKLAQKLGIEQSKVNTALQEVREEHQAERKAELSANLDKAVTDGVITAEQKDLLISKMEEKIGQRRQTRGEIRQWAEDNGIDMSALKDYGFGKGKGGRPGYECCDE